MSANGVERQLSDVECACHCGNFLSQAMADAGRQYIRGHKLKVNGNGNGHSKHRPDILARVREGSEKIVQKVDGAACECSVTLTESAADALWLKLRPEIKFKVVRELLLPTS